MQQDPFFRSAALCGAAAGGLAIAATAGVRIDATQILFALAPTLAYGGCGLWYHADPTRGHGELADAHGALAIGGAVVSALGALGVAAGLSTAPPALAIGAFVAAVCAAIGIKRAHAEPIGVRRTVTMVSADRGGTIVTTVYSIDTPR